MKEINNFDLTKIHTDQTLGFLVAVREKTNLLTTTAVATGIQAFDQAVTAFDEAYKPNSANTHTMSRKEADNNADTIYTGMRMYIDAMTRFPDDEIETVALQAQKIVEKYGNLNNMGYSKQYPNLRRILADLQEIELAKIGLDRWVAALQTAYDDFMSASSDQLAEDAERGVGAVQNERDKAHEAYYTFVRLVNALVIVNGEADFAEFIDTINTLIGDYKALVKGRKTRFGS